MYLPKWSGLYVHVKWFTEDQVWNPQPMAKVITPAFLLWLGVTVAALLVCVLFSQSLERIGLVRRVHQFLNGIKRYHLLILRVGVGLGLLMQLFTGTYLAPAFVSDHVWVYAVLILAIAGLFHRRLLVVSGIALGVLYGYALVTYGLFHGLDYFFYAGVIYYLLVSESRWKQSATPILYLCTGLSLAWLSMEKMTLAKLACSLMHEYGLPTLGFTVEDFVLISAFIEMGLAWAFIMGIMNRFTALLLTGVFLMTTTFFGFKEIVGHTIMHTILILFIIEGSGAAKTLYQFHRTAYMRCLFVAVNFCIVVFGLMGIYIWLGQFNPL